MDTITKDNLLQQSDVEETIVTSTPKQDQPSSETPKRKPSGAARRRLKKAKEGLAGETSIRSGEQSWSGMEGRGYLITQSRYRCPRQHQR